jgi:hypothetical protein
MRAIRKRITEITEKMKEHREKRDTEKSGVPTATKVMITHGTDSWLLNGVICGGAGKGVYRTAIGFQPSAMSYIEQLSAISYELAGADLRTG